MVTVFKNELR